MPVIQAKLNPEVSRKLRGRQEGAGRPRQSKHRVVHHIRGDKFSKNHPIRITFRVNKG